MKKDSEIYIEGVKTVIPEKETPTDFAGMTTGLVRKPLGRSKFTPRVTEPMLQKTKVDSSINIQRNVDVLDSKGLIFDKLIKGGKK